MKKYLSAGGLKKNWCRDKHLALISSLQWCLWCWWGWRLVTCYHIESSKSAYYRVRVAIVPRSSKYCPPWPIVSRQPWHWDGRRKCQSEMKQRIVILVVYICMARFCRLTASQPFERGTWRNTGRPGDGDWQCRCGCMAHIGHVQ